MVSPLHRIAPHGHPCSGDEAIACIIPSSRRCFIAERRGITGALPRRSQKARFHGRPRTRWETGIFATDLIGHLPALRRYATALTGRATEADDLVQDCIERALRGQDTLRAQDRMGAWLRAILHNLVRDDQRRRRDRGPMVDIADMESDLALSVPPQDSSEARDFIRATQTLSAEHRQVLMLVGVEGLSYRTIADELGVPIGTVMSRLARARERLRAALESPPAGVDIVPLRPQRKATS